MQNDILLKRLQDFEFLRGLDHETMTALANSAMWKVFPPHAVVFWEGDTESNLYYLQYGSLKALRTAPDGREQVLRFLDAGEIFTYALGKLDDRGRMFVRANDPVYEGMIVGIHSRENDLVVNATRTKQLTNFRVSGKEDAIKITPPIELTLEYGVEFIEDDELVEITPKSVRLRKRHLSESDRKRASRS